MTRSDLPFWRRKTLGEMTAREWESLCDGCGRCCLLKLEDVDTGDLAYTRLACRLLDIEACRCTDYGNRHDKVPDCVKFSAATVSELDWLPKSCAYRLVADGKDLFWWHPLVSGRPESVHEAGISVRALAISETAVEPDAVERYILRGRRGRL